MIGNSFAIHHYRLASWLRVSGADAGTFLQGQFTNDLRGLAPGAAVYGLWLDQKGKVLADSLVLPGLSAGEFWVASYFSAGDAIRRRLEDYIIADDVTVEDLTAVWSGLALLGEGAEAWWRSQPNPPGLVFPGRRGQAPAWEWIYPLSAADVVAAAVQGRKTLGDLELEKMRILARIPAVPRDIGPGELPNEGGLDETAISYSKGCYLGQEIMARLKSRGNVRRKLMGVAGDGDVPVLPSPLLQAGRPAGELRSAVPNQGGDGFEGLALLTKAGLRLDEPLTLGAEGGPRVRILK
jgi:folate-binding protein YgfZ